MEPTELEQFQNDKKNYSMPIFLTIALVVIAGAFYYFQSGPGRTGSNTNSAPTVSPASMTNESLTSSDESMTSKTETIQAQSLSLEVEGGAFYFEPAVITAKKGESIKLTLTSVDMPHDFVIDELDVKTEIVTKGNSTTIEFTPDQVGEYEYYCSVGNHRAQGMVGKLIVTE